MNKFIIGWFIIITSLISCAKPEQPTPAYTNVQSYFVMFNNCNEFTNNSELPLQTLILACDAACFESYTILLDDINDSIYTIRVNGELGFASIWIDTHQKTCVLDFFCIDDTYCYPDFIETFMSEFQSIENKELTFEELLEMWY